VGGERLRALPPFFQSFLASALPVVGAAVDQPTSKP
jgi:hypothetical protein